LRNNLNPFIGSHILPIPPPLPRDRVGDFDVFWDFLHGLSMEDPSFTILVFFLLDFVLILRRFRHKDF